MEFDDLDDPFKESSKPSRFAPKSSRFQPKTKQSTVKAATPKVEPPVVVKEEEVSTTDARMDIDEELKVKNGDTVELKQEVEKEIPESSNGVEAMEEDVEEEDYVVDEYDVYFTPRDPATQLYVLQYPLRPSWRPYELEQQCTEVRIKPKSGEVEVDLSIDTNSDNYDSKSNFHDIMTKQVLSSSCRLPQATGYAVGVLSGKKLYVNPVHAVVQLRPSMKYLDCIGSKKGNSPNVTSKEAGSNNDALAGPSRKQNKQMDPEAVEPWVSLKYHSSTTELAERYLRNMVTEQKDPLQFLMNPYDYLNCLCPGAVINKMKSSGPSRRSLLSMPLENRITTWLIEGPSVQRFTAIKHIAPDDPVEDVFKVLQEKAHLVQGHWVPKTRFLEDAQKIQAGAESLVRNYALLLFSQSPVIKDSELDILGSQKSIGKLVLREIAIERLYCKDWKFKESPDVTFIKQYPDIVEQQKKLWQMHEPQILQKFAARKARPSLKSSAGPGFSLRSDEGGVRAQNSTRSVGTSMSKETRDALPKLLRKLFQTHKVCSFQAICQGLRDMAVSMSALPKADARTAAAAVAAAKGVDAPQEELQAVISDIAVNVHGVYLLKSSSEHPEFDPLRKVVIDLFLGSVPNAKLKKGEIIEAAKIRLQKEPTHSEFHKVLSEFCVSRGGGWVLKSGDGIPK